MSDSQIPSKRQLSIPYSIRCPNSFKKTTIHSLFYQMPKFLQKDNYPFLIYFFRRASVEKIFLIIIPSALSFSAADFMSVLLFSDKKPSERSGEGFSDFSQQITWYILRYFCIAGYIAFYRFFISFHKPASLSLVIQEGGFSL